jgi:hypothetical protein
VSADIRQGCMQVPATVDHRQAGYIAEHDRRSTESSESSLPQLTRSSVARFACRNLPQCLARQGSRHGEIPVSDDADGRTRFAPHRNGTAVAVPHVHRHGFQFAWGLQVLTPLVTTSETSMVLSSALITQTARRFREQRSRAVCENHPVGHPHPPATGPRPADIRCMPVVTPC